MPSLTAFLEYLIYRNEALQLVYQSLLPLLERSSPLLTPHFVSVILGRRALPSVELINLPDGRRPIYLFALPLSVVGSIGVATSQTMPQLLFWRFWQCIGASPGLVVGAGVIGDIYKLEERGSAMGFFFAVSIEALRVYDDIQFTYAA